MPRDARIGDTHSHGGVIIEGSPNFNVNGIPSSRVGDKVWCPIHGIVAIATGSPTVILNGRRRARIGDLITCGAVITSGSPDVDIGD